MTRRIEDIFKKNARSLPADEERISALRAELLSEIRRRSPLREERDRPVIRPAAAPPFVFLKLKPMIAVALIAALLLGGGGVVAAAQNDVPGDPLYGVKLATEQVQEAVTPSVAARADLAARFAARRIAEAEAVVSAETKDAVISDRGLARVEEAFSRFETRVEALRARLAELPEQDAERLASGLDRAIEAHKEALARIRARADGRLLDKSLQTEAKADALAETVLPKLPRERIRERVEAQLHKAEEVRTRARARLEEARVRIRERAAENIVEEERDEREARERLEEARERFANGFFREALENANAAARLSERAGARLETIRRKLETLPGGVPQIRTLPESSPVQP